MKLAANIQQFLSSYQNNSVWFKPKRAFMLEKHSWVWTNTSVMSVISIF